MQAAPSPYPAHVTEKPRSRSRRVEERSSGTDTATRGTPQPPGPAQRGPRSRRWGIRRVARHPALPWGLAALLLVSTVTFAVLWLGARGTDQQQVEVADTSRRFLAALTTFSAKTIEDDVAQIRDFAVGNFATEVDATFSPSRIAAIRGNEAVSTGRVKSVFVQSIEGSSATVFGVVNETIVNDDLPAPRLDVLRVELGLVETPGGWKVNSVRILQSPGPAPFG